MEHGLQAEYQSFMAFACILGRLMIMHDPGEDKIFED